MLHTIGHTLLRSLGLSYTQLLLLRLLPPPKPTLLSSLLLFSFFDPPCWGLHNINNTETIFVGKNFFFFSACFLENCLIILFPNISYFLECNSQPLFE